MSNYSTVTRSIFQAPLNAAKYVAKGVLHVAEGTVMVVVGTMLGRYPLINFVKISDCKKIFDLCKYFENVLPGYDSYKSLHTNVFKKYNLDKWVLDPINFEISVRGPIYEELFFRLGIQELLLKRLPKKIIQKFAPSKASWVDCRVAQIARITLSSALFAMAHVDRAVLCKTLNNCDSFIGTLIQGLIAGVIQEKTNNIFYSTALHIAHNYRLTTIIRTVT